MTAKGGRYAHRAGQRAEHRSHKRRKRERRRQQRQDRQQAGVSLRTMAKAVGVRASTLIRWEAGQVRPRRGRPWPGWERSTSSGPSWRKTAQWRIRSRRAS